MLITVRDIMTPRSAFIACLPGDLVSQVGTAVPPTYDVIPVLSGLDRADPEAQVIGLLNFQRLGSRTLTVRVETVMDGDPRHEAVSADLPLINHILSLKGESFSLVRDDFKTIGLVTISDLERPAVRIALFVVLTELELLVNAIIKTVSPDPSEWSTLISRSDVGLQKALSHGLMRTKRPETIGADILSIPYAVKLALLAGLSARSSLPGLDLRSLPDSTAMRSDIALGTPFPSVARLPQLTRDVVNLCEDMTNFLQTHRTVLDPI